MPTIYTISVPGAQSLDVTSAIEALQLARAVKDATVSSDVDGERRLVYSAETEKALAAGRRVGLIALADEEAGPTPEQTTAEVERLVAAGLKVIRIDGPHFRTSACHPGTCPIDHALEFDASLTDAHAERPTTASFTSPVVIGAVVSGTTKGDGFSTDWSGVYEGIKASEWDGEPVHFFRDGILGTTPQTSFALPVAQFGA